MASLYRRYRPTHFDEVIGQEHIASVLRKAITTNKVNHAYIFSGPRGTGKTTFARLFSKAINCQKPGGDGNPCNKCEICSEILGGSAVDVIEIDAASNRGIDEIRELRERVAFSPVRAKFKIYIIDEVHMLTREAFNALLKTLEEPPAHAIFILATTELNKVPETILSRCQRFHFHRANPEQLRSLLERVAKAEKLKLADDAYDVLISRSEGSFRDSLSILGALTDLGETISAETLNQRLGLPPAKVVEQIQVALDNGDVKSLQQLLKESLDQGLDLVVTAKSLADRYKDLVLFPESVSTDQLARNASTLEKILVGLSRSRYSSDPTGSVIASLVELAASRASRRVVIESLAKEEAPKQVESIQQPDSSLLTKKEEEERVDPISKPSKPIEGAEEFWSALLYEIKDHNHALYMLLKSAHLLDLTDSKMLLGVRFRFYSERLFESKNRRLLENSAEKVSGKKLALECEVRSDLGVTSSGDEDLLNAVVDVFELEEV